MTNISYELKPEHTRQKSFYGKAVVVAMDEDNAMCYSLFSYSTLVVWLYVGSGGAVGLKRTWGGYSVTTLRHVNELLMQQGFPKLSARAWRAMEVGKFYSPDDIPAL